MVRRDDSGHERDWGEVRRNFEQVWAPSRWRYMQPEIEEPSVEELLGVDREYRARIAAPGPSRRPDAWLVQRAHRQYIVRFAQALAPGPNHEVLLGIDGATPGRHYLVATGRHGLLEGKRIVRGRELECLAFYRSLDSTAA